MDKDKDEDDGDDSGSGFLLMFSAGRQLAFTGR